MNQLLKLILFAAGFFALLAVASTLFGVLATNLDYLGAWISDLKEN